MNKKSLGELQTRVEAVKSFLRLNAPEKCDDLIKQERTWDPEIKSTMYSEWINLNFFIDPNDIVSLSVYSIFMNIPIMKLKERIIEVHGDDSIKR